MNTMTNDETYNGYANRETWAFNLHWQNDQGLYNETLEQARQWAEEYPHIAEADLTASLLGRHIIDYWDEWLSEYRENYGRAEDATLEAFRVEVGSWWRVDAREVGEAVRESLANES